MTFIVVESPTKAKTLSRFLGSEFAVEATMGHIKDLPKSKLGVDLENNFSPQYQDVEKRKEQIKKIQRLAKKAKRVFIATDPDREGEAIASHVEEILTESANKKPPYSLERIVFHEITKHAVEEAIAHPREVDRNLVNAQTARRVLDRLVGYKLSPLLWKKVRRGLSAGRVQSVAVRLIVEREKEIEQFKPVEYWQIFVTVVSKSGTFDVELLRFKGKKLEIHTEDLAIQTVDALENGSYIVSDIKKREVRKHPYPPFTTSTMTQAAARNFGWSAKRTMQMAQGLYEKGLITYHRTDSTNIASVAINSVREYITQEIGQQYLPEKPRFYKTNAKVAQEAHEAVRPTHIANKTIEAEASESKLYDLIWRRFVACQMKESIYDETAIEVSCGDYGLRASGQIMKFDGWRRVYGRVDNAEMTLLPQVEKGEQLKKEKVKSEQKFTQPPPRYNEASLIKTLEKLGIGRPSTYAPTISTIQLRGYVEKTEGKFFATSVGVAVNEFLTKNFSEVVDYAFTANMEDDLDHIANGKLQWEKSMKDFWDPFTKKLDEVEKNASRVKIEAEKLGKPCPTCNEGELVIRTGRFGKFISCSRFPECKHTEKYVEKIEMKCLECKLGDVVVKKTGKGRVFYGCSRYPECKWASWKKPTLDQSQANSPL